MTYTRAGLILEALSQLKVIGAGQPAAAEDAALVDGKIDAVAADLSARRVVYIADLDDIPAEAFLPLATCVAASCADDFGVTRQKLPDGSDILVLAAERQLRAQASRPTYTTLPVDYF